MTQLCQLISATLFTSPSRSNGSLRMVNSTHAAQKNPAVTALGFLSTSLAAYSRVKSTELTGHKYWPRRSGEFIYS